MCDCKTWPSLARDEEQACRDRREITVEGEVVPLENIADDAGDNYPPAFFRDFR